MTNIDRFGHSLVKLYDLYDCLFKFYSNLFEKQECIPVGCVPAVCRSLLLGGGSPWQGGLLGRGGLLVGGVSLAGGSPWQGGLLGGGLLGRGVSQHAVRQTPPLVNRMTDRCKNITLATTSLRPVIILHTLEDVK